MKSRLALLSNILLLVGTLGFSLIISEIALALFIQPPKRYYTWHPNLHFEFKPDPEIFYGVDGIGHFRTNSLGHRGGAALTAEEQILTVGGSTTECLYLDNTETWPFLLQGKLNEADRSKKYNVANVGRSGHRSSDHLVTIHYHLNQPPKFSHVILMLGINDLTYFLANHKNFQVKSPTELINDEVMINRSFYLHPKIWKPQYPWSPLILKLGREGYRYLQKQLLENPSQDIEGKVYRTWQEARQSAPDLEDTLPSIAPATEQLKSNLTAIKEILNKSDTKLVLVTQPYAWKDLKSEEENLRYWLGMTKPGQEWKGGGAYFSINVLREGLQALNMKTLEFCTDENVTCINAHETLSENKNYFWDDVHFSEAGAKALSELISENFLKISPPETSERE